MKIYPIYNEPALMIKNDLKTLVIADIHIGIENELKKSGFNIPNQTGFLLNKILLLIKKYKIDNLIIIGDIKHEVPGISKQEWRELPIFFEKLNKVVKIFITVGNHDTGIKTFINEKIYLYDSEGFVFEDFGFFHGHAWPSKEVMDCKMKVMAHLHSTVTFKDSNGRKIIKPCWYRTSFTGNVKNRYEKCEGEIIIMPAFNPLCGGGSYIPKKNLSPIISNKLIDIENTKIYLLNGTQLNKSELLTVIF